MAEVILGVAGLAVGAVSLGIQLADGTRKAFVVLENAVHAEGTCRAFACSLAIEHARFDSWARIARLDEAHETGRQFEIAQYCGPALIPLLSEMHIIMIQLSEKEGKYSKLIDDPGDTALHNSAGATIDISEPRSLSQGVQKLSTKIKSVDSGLVSSRSGSGTTRKRHRPFVDIIERCSKSSKILLSRPARYRWVILDEAACNTKLARIQQLNGFLEEALDRNQRVDLAASVEQFRLMFVQFQADLQGSLTALISAPTTTPDHTIRSAETLVESQDLTHSYIQRAARFVLEAVQAAPTDSRLGTELSQTIQSAITGSDDSRAFATLSDDRDVWIEWKHYTEVLREVNGQLEIGMDDNLVRRMDSMVSLLKITKTPPEFCVPPCLGYFVDAKEARFGIVYEVPEGAASTKPRTLLSCFRNKHVPLSARVGIALRLAEWLLYLHSVRWLHKGIRSSNILFFENSKYFGQPFITGFEHARSGASGQNTTKPPDDATEYVYVHPHYLGPKQIEGYRKMYDIYSLGVVLIELARWQSMADIVIEARDSDIPAKEPISKQEAEGLQRQMLDGKVDILDSVRACAGDKYYGVVRACLSGYGGFNLPDTSDEYDNCTSAELLESFIDTVVTPLRHIVI